MPALVFLKALPWRIILPVIAALGLLWLCYDWAYDRGAASRDGEVQTLTTERDTAVANVATLRKSLGQQNAAIADLAKRKEASDKAATAAVEAGQKRARELAGTKAKLADVARERASQPVVPVPDAVRDAWGKLP